MVVPQNVTNTIITLWLPVLYDRFVILIYIPVTPEPVRVFTKAKSEKSDNDAVHKCVVELAVSLWGLP